MRLLILQILVAIVDGVDALSHFHIMGLVVLRALLGSVDRASLRSRLYDMGRLGGRNNCRSKVGA